MRRPSLLTSALARARVPFLGFCLALGAGCRSVEPTQPLSTSNALSSLELQIEELYVAFCFDARSEPDWRAQREIYLEGAAFVAPIRPGITPRGQDQESFIADFRAFSSSDGFVDTGFHERIIDTRIEIFGGIAHAFVLFEGFYPPEGQAATRGVDSLQFVHDGSSWRLVSFTTQFESETQALPSGL
jgi:hypothetical protein